MHREQLTVHPVEYGSITPRGQGSKLQVGRSVARGGFTLLEILVTMSIFSISFLALAAAASSVMRANQTSYASTIATNFAQDKMEELMAGTALPVACTAFDIVGCSDTPTSPSDVTFNRSWRITANAPVAGVTRIEIQLDWNDHTGHSLTLSSAVDL